MTTTLTHRRTAHRTHLSTREARRLATLAATWRRAALREALERRQAAGWGLAAQAAAAEHALRKSGHADMIITVDVDAITAEWQAQR